MACSPHLQATGQKHEEENFNLNKHRNAFYPQREASCILLSLKLECREDNNVKLKETERN